VAVVMNRGQVPIVLSCIWLHVVVGPMGDIAPIMDIGIGLDPDLFFLFFLSNSNLFEISLFCHYSILSLGYPKYIRIS